MLLKIFEFISVVFTGPVAAMFIGPWAALTRSLASFAPETMITIARRLNDNMAPLMTPLMPAAIISSLPLMYMAYGNDMAVFSLAFSACAFLLASLYVTMAIEVPVVRKIMSWDANHLPANWQMLRDRWVGYHVYRVAAGAVAFLALMVAAIFA